MTESKAGPSTATKSKVDYRFDHVGFLTPNMDHTLATYQAIGCEVTERLYRRDSFDFGFVTAGTDVMFEIQTSPLPVESQQYLERQGWSIERVAFSCADAHLAYDELMAAGVTSGWEPRPFELNGVTVAIAGGVLSPEGLIIDIVQYLNPTVPRPTRGPRADLALHHACYLTPDLAAAETFWTETFGLVKTYDFTAPMTLDDGRTGTKGFVMLSDPFFDADGHEFSLEIIGGEFDSIDGPTFERRGPCYDHVCFTTDDVAGVWQRAVDRGVEPLCEPAYYPEYDSTIAWLYDADGNHVELMSPVPPDLMTTAAATGVCSNHWVDDWQRSPVVLERQGNQPIQIARDQ